MAKKNTYKSKTDKPKKKKSNKKLSLSIPKIENERFIKTTGIILMTLGVFLILSFISYIANWKFDQDKIDHQSFFNFVFSGKEVVIRNSMGKFGAYTAHVFLNNWFGVISFLISFYLILVSIKLLFKKSLLSLWKSFQVLIFSCFWISLTLGYFVNG